MVENSLEQRLHVVRVTLWCQRCPAFPGRGEEGREVELFIAGIEGREEIEHFLFDLTRPLIRPVDLVDDTHRPQPQRQRLGEHESGLGHRAFRGVHQHENAIHHAEDTFNLASEVGVSGCVDYVDRCPFPDHRGALGENGDAALALEIVRIECPVGDPLVVTERAGLAEQHVHQRRLSVIDMGDDRNIAQVHHEDARLEGGTRRVRGTITPKCLDARTPVWRRDRCCRRLRSAGP